MLGEAAVTAEQADALLRGLRGARSTPSARRRARPRHLRGAGHLDQALGAASALQPRAASSACMAELYPRLQGAGACWRARYDIGLNIDAEEADRLELSLDLLERLCFEPELAGWNGIGFVVQAYQKRAPFVIDWLIDLARRTRPPADGAAGQGRLLGRRDQARPGRRAGRTFPVFTRKIHTDVSYLACARKLLAAPDARLPAVRHAQRADARHHPRDGRRRTSMPASTSSSACTAWASRCTRRSSGRTSSTGRAASTRRSARTRRCSPIWCAACWRTAPTPRSSTRSPIPRCRSTTLLRRSRRAGAGAAAGRRAASAHRAAARPLRRGARNSRGLDLANEQVLAALAAIAAATRRAGRRRADAGRRAAQGRRRARCAIRPIAATWSARSSRRRLSWSTAACAAARGRGRPTPASARATACGGPPT